MRLQSTCWKRLKKLAIRFGYPYLITVLTHLTLPELCTFNQSSGCPHRNQRLVSGYAYLPYLLTLPYFYCL
jgi:hypothetical protein